MLHNAVGEGVKFPEKGVKKMYGSTLLAQLAFAEPSVHWD